MEHSRVGNGTTSQLEAWRYSCPVTARVAAYAMHLHVGDVVLSRAALHHHRFCSNVRLVQPSLPFLPVA